MSAATTEEPKSNGFHKGITFALSVMIGADAGRVVSYYYMSSAQKKRKEEWNKEVDDLELAVENGDGNRLIVDETLPVSGDKSITSSKNITVQERLNDLTTKSFAEVYPSKMMKDVSTYAGIYAGTGFIAAILAYKAINKFMDNMSFSKTKKQDAPKPTM